MPSEQDADADASTHSASGSESDGDTETSGDSESTDETGEDPCDWDAYLACVAPVEAAFDACHDACTEPMLTCADEACMTGCFVSQTEQAWACREAHCPEPINEWDLCTRECRLEELGCSEAEGCELHECSHDRYLCLWDCDICNTLKLDFEWAGSCELVLPKPLYPVTLPYSYVEIGAIEGLIVEAENESCGEPGIGGVFAPFDPQTSPDRFTLCPDTCDAFAELGLLRFVSNSPPCE